MDTAQLQEYSMCVKGEAYLTVRAASEEEARELALETLAHVPVYFKVRDTIVTRYDSVDEAC